MALALGPSHVDHVGPGDQRRAQAAVPGDRKAAVPHQPLYRSRDLHDVGGDEIDLARETRRRAFQRRREIGERMHRPAP